MADLYQDGSVGWLHYQTSLLSTAINSGSQGAAGCSQHRGCGSGERGFDGTTGDIQNIFRLQLDVRLFGP